MTEKYFVLYERDVKTEQRKEYKEMMLFDKLDEFEKLEDAKECATLNLPAILARRYPLEYDNDLQLKDKEKPYIIVAEDFGKYRHYDYTGDSDALTTYDAVRCKKENIDSELEEFAKEEHAEKVYVGLELRVI